MPQAKAKTISGKSYACLAIALLLAVASVTAPFGSPSIPALAARIAPAVVAIECDVMVPMPDPEAGATVMVPAKVAGSGVLVSSDGLLVTNHHVVDGAVSITVTLYNGVRVPARLLGSSESVDLAVLEIPGTRLPHLRIGAAESLKVGQAIVSMGNGHGLGRNGDTSLTSGVVSGLRRAMRPGSVWYEMDAPIYPGCSGGPVCDTAGRVVGINVAVSNFLKPFFIPLDAANRAVLHELSDGRVR